MKRKIVKQGVATNTISLPAKWVKNQGLQAGDEVEVEESANKIIISTSSEPAPQKIKLRIPSGGSRRLTRRYLDSAYRKGFDEMYIEFDHARVIPDIEWCLQQFVGFEIVEQSQKYCRIKNIIGPSESDFDNIFRRFLLLIMETSKESQAAILENNQEKMKALIERDQVINRLYLFCQRLIIKRGEKFFPKKEAFVFLIANRFEEIADVYRDVSNYCLHHPVKLSGKTIHLFEEVNSLLERLYHFYYKFDDNEAIFIDTQKENLTKRISELLSSSKNSEDIVVLHYLLDIVTYIYEAASPIFSVSMKEEVLP